MAGAPPRHDTSAEAVTGRIIRLRAHIQQRFDEAFGAHGLNGTTDGVLVALRRAGATMG